MKRGSSRDHWLDETRLIVGEYSLQIISSNLACFSSAILLVLDPRRAPLTSESHGPVKANIEIHADVEKAKLDSKARYQERNEMTQEARSKGTCTQTGLNVTLKGGTLVPLKTILETRARDSFISVYVTSVPVKQASRTLE
jgi:hypothetical protein